MQAQRRSRFGYSVVAACFMAQALSIGLSIAAYPIVMKWLESDLGATRTQASLGIPLVLISGALCAPFIGRFVDRGSPRRMMMLGAVVQGLGLVAVSRSTSLGMALLAWVLLVGPGHSMLGVLPAMTVISNWFVTRRARMIGVTAVGTTFGGALAPPLAEALTTAFGWRDMMMYFGIATILLGVPILSRFVIKRPEDVGLHPDGALSAPAPDAATAGAALPLPLWRDTRYWLLGGVFALTIGASISLVTHLVPFAAEKGISRSIAVAALTLNSVFAAFGKLAFGASTDRIGGRRSYQLGALIQACGWVGILASTGWVGLYAGAALYAFGAGSLMPTQAALVAELWGRASFGRVSGMLGLLSMAGMLVFPVLVGAAFERSGSYGLPMSWMLVAVLVPVFLLFFVQKPALAGVVATEPG